MTDQDPAPLPALAQHMVIECITCDPKEPAAQKYRDVCATVADLVATSRFCPEGEGACGGHPICRPCYELARAEGLVR